MEWLEALGSIGRDSYVRVKVIEARFTQSTVHLHRVGITLTAGNQNFAAQAAVPRPVDPLSLRYKAEWPDSELWIPLTGCDTPHTATLVISDRRRRQRTALGTISFPLNPSNYPQHSGSRLSGGHHNTVVHHTLRVSSGIFPSLNIKVDISIEAYASHDTLSEWLSGAPSDRAPPIADLDRNTPASTDILSEDMASSIIPDLDHEAVTPTPTTVDPETSLAFPPSIKHGFGFNIASESVGVVYLEILSASNLPRFRTLTGLSFDMDPFVVVSFGQRTFRTPTRRHTLNPTFNSKIVFEVGKHECNFDIVFDMWDRDRITLNDRVASTRLPLQDIAARGPQLLPNSKLYNLDIYEPETMAVPLTLASGDSSVNGETPTLLLRMHYYPLAAVRQQLWRGVITLYDADEYGALSQQQLIAMLNSMGSTLRPSTIDAMFLQNSKNPREDLLKTDEIVLGLENLVDHPQAAAGERVILFRLCPMCQKQTKEISQRSFIQHLSVCASRHWQGSTALLDSRYVSPQQASRRWYTKFLSKFSYGSYYLGANSANILVQDRLTGQISEEKMATSVRLGIRMLYAMGPVETKRIQRLLRKYTLRQGIKYSHPSSASQIKPFIKFHGLDMSEVLEPVEKFKTFNEFFYRKLKPGVRPCENSEEPRTAVSCADCRLTVFKTVEQATELWIKGRTFTLNKLLSPYEPGDKPFGPLLIFRLAPQDYHRVHVPVDGVVGKPVHIPGQYYTVNPMAVRSSLDVYGENSRTVVPIHSPEFGRVVIVLIGAMMVGSIVLSVQEGQTVHRTDELGYFQFGGSTLLLLFESGRAALDSDLVANSERAIETLVHVGMSVAHTPDIPEYIRVYDTRLTAIKRARTNIAGGGSYVPFSLD